MTIFYTDGKLFLRTGGGKNARLIGKTWIVGKGRPGWKSFSVGQGG